MTVGRGAKAKARLQARVDAWEKLEGASSTSPSTKRVGGDTYHRPGSQKG